MLYAVCCAVCRAVLCCAALQVISGLVKFVPKDQMENRRVVSEADETAATATAAQGQHSKWFSVAAYGASSDGAQRHLTDWLCPVTCAETCCCLLLSAAVLCQVVCCNLKPAKMRDIMSYGMVRGFVGFMASLQGLLGCKDVTSYAFRV